jgi:hypothetical protein
MLYKTFDWVMTKLGHKYAFVDVAGDVAVYRYYVFFVEKNAPDTWKEKFLPNLLIHHFIGNNSKNGAGNIHIDEISHVHPWSTLSFILKGGYTEELNYKTIKENKRFSFIVRGWNECHRFLNVKNNTWTLFFHGIRQGIWATQDRDFSLTEHTEIHSSSKKSKGWRNSCWIKCDEDFNSMMDERKAAIARSKKKPTPQLK